MGLFSCFHRVGHDIITDPLTDRKLSMDEQHPAGRGVARQLCSLSQWTRRRGGLQRVDGVCHSTQRLRWSRLIMGDGEMGRRRRGMKEDGAGGGSEKLPLGQDKSFKNIAGV